MFFNPMIKYHKQEPPTVCVVFVYNSIVEIAFNIDSAEIVNNVTEVEERRFPALSSAFHSSDFYPFVYVL